MTTQRNQHRHPINTPQGGQYAPHPLTPGMRDRDKFPPPHDTPSQARISHKALHELPNRIDLGTGVHLEKIISLTQGPAVIAAIQTHYDHLAPWFPWAASRNADLAVFEQWFNARKKTRNEAPVDYNIMIDGAVNGRISAWKHPDGTVELGYWLGAAHTGQGHATRALQAVETHLAAGGVTAFEIHYVTHNAASARIAARNGYTEVGTYTGRPTDPDTEHVIARKTV